MWTVEVYSIAMFSREEPILLSTQLSIYLYGTQGLLRPLAVTQFHVNCVKNWNFRG